MDKPKTVGDLLIRANASKDPDKIKNAIQLFWGAAKSVGLPTPVECPPKFLDNDIKE